MIKRKFERYCDDIENVENYEKAKADDFKGWACHHRLELVATGGVCDVCRQGLIDWNVYWHRPADELIFLTTKEHTLLHKPNKGNHHSEETKKKISGALKGKKLGPCSEETRKRLSEVNKGKRLSEETRNKMSEVWKGKPKLYLRGKHWKIVDGKRVWY